VTSPVSSARLAARKAPQADNRKHRITIEGQYLPLFLFCKAYPVPRIRFQAFDLLSSLVAVVDSRGRVIYANSALEDALGASRRVIEGSKLGRDFAEPQALEAALDGVAANAFASLRYDALLLPQGGNKHDAEPIPVHVIITQTEQQ
jgi:two-component system, NtrC family, nitrogen regulation sensor histidine kinase GlnL